MDKAKITVIVGPTASGKSSLAVELAGLFNGEVISADSMQVFKFMDIGTAKPTLAERSRVPHHLIDVKAPDQEYTAARFRDDAAQKIEEIRGRRKNVFIAGGTGLYIKALTEGLFEGPRGDPDLRDELLREAQLEGREQLHKRLSDMDPESAASIHPNNLKRVIRALEVYHIAKRPISAFHKDHAFKEKPYDALKIGVKKGREALYRDIDDRVDEMFADGLVEEVQGLLAMGYSSDLKPMCALGYKEVLGFLKGAFSLSEAIRLVKRNTRHYAKRQMTWFKKDREVRWFSPGEKSLVIEAVRGHLE
jgi:tRNA dimethylallyltransferase